MAFEGVLCLRCGTFHHLAGAFRDGYCIRCAFLDDEHAEALRKVAAESDAIEKIIKAAHHDEG